MQQASKYIGLVFLLLLSVYACGQKTPSFVGIRLGPSIPYADFGTDGTARTHGFAGIGGSIKAEIAYFYSPNVGVGFLAGFNMHPLDTDEFEKQMISNEPGVSNLRIESQGYYSTNYMIGYYFNNPITHTILSFTSNILGITKLGKGTVLGSQILFPLMKLARSIASFDYRHNRLLLPS